MRKFAILSGILLALGAPPALADDLDTVINPLEDAKVGEWAEYRSEVVVHSPEGEDIQEAASRVEVVAVVGFRVELQVTEGEGDEKSEQVIHLVSSDPVLAQLTGGYAEVNVETSEAERTDLELGGKTYRTQKVHLVFTGKGRMHGMTVPMRVDQTVWFCVDVPATGQVQSISKIEFELFSQKIVQEVNTTLSGSSAG